MYNTYRCRERQPQLNSLKASNEAGFRGFASIGFLKKAGALLQKQEQKSFKKFQKSS
jgi:hypothetical protein